MNSEFTEKLTTIQRRIAAAAARAGTDPDAVEIVAVTKAHSAEALREALAAGLHHLGESKVQEAGAKRAELGECGCWHLIGHLQSNKAKHAVRLFDRIDSVDSLSLAQELSRRAEEADETVRVLLQVNIAGEAQKFGLAPDAVETVAEAVNELPALTLEGLMTLAPYSEEPEDARPTFAGLRELRDMVEASTGLALPALSMGMSGDFEVAVEEGATEIRLGTVLFGQRNYSKARRAAAQEDFPIDGP